MGIKIGKVSMTNLRLCKLKLLAAEIGEDNPLPMFNNLSKNANLECDESVPVEDRSFIGWQLTRRVLPYRLQDNYIRNKKTKSFEAIILENDYLKATFLPELGGRLISLIYKKENRELLFFNPVIQPANLALRDAWFAGGIEYNIGHPGHAYHTCDPVFTAEIKGIQGEPALRIYEWERLKKIIWQIDFHLPPDSKFLFAKAKIINTNEYEIPIFGWMNFAVPYTEDIRVIAPAGSMLYLDYLPERNLTAIRYSELPYAEVINLKDSTYPINWDRSISMFFRTSKNKRPWITALDKDGSGLFECSTSKLFGRKYFYWGTHQGGKHWQEFLSVPGREYIEIQAGLSHMQEQCIPMPGYAEWTWTEAFGFLKVEPSEVHNKNWTGTWRYVDRIINKILPEDEILRLDDKFYPISQVKLEKILTTGSGWGALEKERIKADNTVDKIPRSVLFKKTSINNEQKKWLNLLKTCSFPQIKPWEKPGDFMIQEEWLIKLEDSVKSKERNNWFAWFHLGIMYMENGFSEKAKSAWEISAEKAPSCWTYRNLAQIEIMRNNLEEACEMLKKAWDLCLHHTNYEPHIAFEYLQCLFSFQKFDDALKFYNSLPQQIRQNERIIIIRAMIALELDDFKLVEEILKKEFTWIIEGETILTDIWFKMWEKHLSIQAKKPDLIDVIKKVKEKYPPPKNIDFRIKE